MANDFIETQRSFWDRCFRAARAEPAEGAARATPDLSDIVTRLARDRARRVLDLGCGTGRLSTALAKEGFRVTAADISEEAICILEERAEQEGLAIATHVCACQDLGPGHGRFDAVICASVLDHMPPEEASRSLNGILSVLKPGGLLFASFDGAEEEPAAPAGPPAFTTRGDGTREYVRGAREGMLWRYYTDEEIRGLLAAMEVLELRTRAAGRREAWARLAQGKPSTAGPVSAPRGSS